MENTTVYCAICNMEITHLGTDLRTFHVENCFDGASSKLKPATDKCVSRLKPEDAVVLARLASCPVCGTEWLELFCEREMHIEECAKQHQLSKENLHSLLILFQESLDNGQGLFTASTSSSEYKSNSTGKISTGTPAKQKKILPLPNATSLKRARIFAKEKSKRNSVDSPKKKTIDCWFGKQIDSSAEGSEISNISKRRQSNNKLAKCLEFEIESDEEFQNTKVCVPLRQTCISIQKGQSKRKQEFLDELDNDLNEAKALSLSLVRIPDAELNTRIKARSGSAKRRGITGIRTEDSLAASEILASTEAQDYIRQRAAAFAHMDNSAIRDDKGKSSVYSLPLDAETPSTDFNSSRSGLWHLGALSEPADREYCTIFEKYKIPHSGHSSINDCIQASMGFILQEIAFEISREQQPTDNVVNSVSKYVHLRRAYVQMLHGLHVSFEKQRQIEGCREWAYNGSKLVDENQKEDNIAAVTLSSSESEQNSSHFDIPAYDLSLDNPPEYAKMDLGRLRHIAEGFGLRVDTPKRLLVHQLQNIWERTHASSRNPQNKSRREKMQSTMDPHIFSRIRELIRSNRNLYERILCYQVLNFNVVYQEISEHIHCQRYMLKRYFDSEGIVYSSFYD